MDLADRFRKDVLQGLTASPKFLQSKYFYDAEGDRLFQEIMESPEYYLTSCEMEIFVKQSADLAERYLRNYGDFDIIELGPGDASKSSHLLRYLNQAGVDFTYYPVDISANVISQLEHELPVAMPGLAVRGLHGEYIEMVRIANDLSRSRKLILFLGSNIGNFFPEEAIAFLSAMKNSLHPGDLMLIGFDLKKDPRQILAAYDDKAGITRLFNLNLLKRINRELDANFDLEQFEHYPTYDPVSGACRSFLISKSDQTVYVSGKPVYFARHEPVYMERSEKYSVPEIDKMAVKSGFKTVDYFFDSKGWFLDVLWQRL